MHRGVHMQSIRSLVHIPFNDMEYCKGLCILKFNKLARSTNMISSAARLIIIIIVY